MRSWYFFQMEFAPPPTKLTMFFWKKYKNYIIYHQQIQPFLWINIYLAKTVDSHRIFSFFWSGNPFYFTDLLLLFGGFPNIYEVPHGSKVVPPFPAVTVTQAECHACDDKCRNQEIGEDGQWQDQVGFRRFSFLSRKASWFKQSIFVWLEGLNNISLDIQIQYLLVVWCFRNIFWV